MSNVGTPENTAALAEAAALLNADCQDLPPVLAFRLAEVFRQWARIGGWDPDLLNRVGGPETIALAHAVIAHLTPKENA